MPKVKSNELNVKQIAAISVPGNYADGGGLYLQVSKTGAKSWIFKFRYQGKLKEMGLGSFRNTSLKAARANRDDAKKILDEGRNPITERKVSNISNMAPIPTFFDFGQKMITLWSGKWKNKKGQYQWEKLLVDEAAIIAEIPIDRITTSHILDVLNPIWNVKPETASRTRSRIKLILDAAKVEGFRTGDNPARWPDHLKHYLPPPKKLYTGHHAALPYKELPDFMQKLRERDTISAAALEFCILTVARTNEVRFAQKSEIDLKNKLWIIPAHKMKEPRPHIVPLCDRAIEIVQKALLVSLKLPDPYIFVGGARKRKNSRNPEQLGHLSNGAMTKVLSYIAPKYTVHGFRSTFRDWVSDTTDFPEHIAEAALAHLKGDAIERAYRRGDALERRKELMEDWANYCNGK